MTNPNIPSEMKSIGRYIKWIFPDKQLHFFRPDAEDTPFDILVEFVEPQFISQGKAATIVRIPVVVYYKPTDYWDAVKAQEKFRTLLLKGVSKTVTTPEGEVKVSGHKNRIPMWIWPESGLSPNIKDFIGYLRVEDISSRVVEQEEPGWHILQVEFTVQSYRVDWEETGPAVTTVNVNGMGANNG